MKRTLFYGATALGLLFTACQSDDLNPGSEVSTDYARTFYVNLNIRTDGAEGMSRADGDGNPTFDNGEGESTIREAYFVFYDQAGNVVGGEPVAMDLSTVEWKAEAADGSVEKYCQSVVGVTVGNGSDNPARVICYLNPKDATSLSKPLSEIQAEARPNGIKEVNGEKVFSMSNSVYYTNTTSEAPQIAVPIAPNQLFNTREAANQALSDRSLTVDIYVERYASKIGFNAAEPDVYQTISRNVVTNAETGIALTFVPKTWMVNASCDQTYIIKSFREEDSTNGNMLIDNYGYDELDKIINKNRGDWKWNNADYHRSYWGMSPAYFTGTYPEVSSDVEGLKGNLHQHYYSYNELIDAQGEPKGGFELPVGKAVTEYVNETTVGSKALGSKNIVAALPSVIYVGDYTLKINDQELTATDFYTYGVVDVKNDKPVVYFDVKEGSLNGESAIAGGESILRGLIKGATNLYKKVTVNGEETYTNFDLTNKDDLEKLVAVLEVADLNLEDNEDIKGNLKVPERYRTLKFAEGVTAEQLNGIYVGTSQGYRVINADPNETTLPDGEISLLRANQELMKVVGFAAKYNAGAAYFNIPVKHLGWYRTQNENYGKEEIDWSKVRVGDFGMVRNHSYNINVTEIVGLGTGIGGKDNPIVPPAEENRYYIAYQVNILKWAIVPTQNVKL